MLVSIYDARLFRVSECIRRTYSLFFRRRPDNELAVVFLGGLLRGEHLLPQRGGKQERRAHYQAADSEPCDLGPRKHVRKVGREGNVRGPWRLRVCLVALLR